MTIERLNELASIEGNYGNAATSEALYAAADRIEDLQDALARMSAEARRLGKHCDANWIEAVLRGGEIAKT